MRANGDSDLIRVLLVDDDEDEHIIVAGLLRSTPGEWFTLTSVSTYSAGLEAILSSRFDVCLVDYRLGERDGLELVAAAKQKLSEAEIILLTGAGTNEVDMNAAKAGVGDYLIKHGLTATVLERSVRYAVERGRTTANLLKLLSEKDLLIKEVHHRVKNNLQVICSLLSLQIGCSDGGGSAEALRQAHSRVMSMSMVHEHLHKSDTLLSVDFGHYIRSLATRLFEAYCIDSARIHLELSTESISLPADDAITCGLILNELVSNALKHAFRDGRDGRLRIVFRRVSSDEIELTVGDDGLGLPVDFQVETVRSLGWRVIRALTEQLGSNVRLHKDVGTEVALTWQLPCSKSAEAQVDGRTR